MLGRVSLAVAVWCGLALSASSASAQSAQKPKLPPGIDPGGVAIGVITQGIDYRTGIVSRCLARDGEGELIGWDLVDRDRLPFAPHAPGVVDDGVLVSAVNCDGRVRLVPVRIDVADAVSVSQAVAFLATTPARIVVLPAWNRPNDWTAFRLAAAKFARLLIVVAELGGASAPTVGDLANVTIVAGSAEGGDAEASMLALGRAVSLVACGKNARDSAATGADLRALLVEQMARSPTTGLGELMSPKCG